MSWTMDRKQKKHAILTKTLEGLTHKHYSAVTFADAEMLSGVHISLVKYYFPKIKTLRAALLKTAVETDNAAILAQAMGILADVADAPEYLKKRAVKLICEHADIPAPC